MKAGAGRAEIKFPVGFFPSEGFTKVLSLLYVRAFILDEQKTGFCLLSLEITSLPEDEVNHLRDLLSNETGIKKDNCWITVTHTFSAPHILPQKQINSELMKRNITFHNIIEAAAKESIKQALTNMAEARLSFGKSECLVNVNRDMNYQKVGGWVIAE